MTNYFQFPTAVTVTNRACTEPIAYSDSVGTWEKCHCNQIVTVSRGSLLTNPSFGNCKNCQCNRFVTVTGVTVTNSACIEFTTLVSSLSLHLLLLDAAVAVAAAAVAAAVAVVAAVVGDVGCLGVSEASWGAGSAASWPGTAPSVREETI